MNVEVCGVGSRGYEMHLERLRELETRALRRIQATQASAVRLDDGLAILTADETTAPGWTRFDLAGETLRFSPIATGGYRVAKSRAIEKSRGTRFDRGTSYAAKYVLSQLIFPFGGVSVSEVYIARTPSIYLAPAEDDRTRGNTRRYKRSTSEVP
jgi:hypothetical protein